MIDSTSRLRFAPSPTGYLHVGGARTALFNWLLARAAGGKFILRIEDTDLERSTEEMTRAILDSLQWLGLDWDEGPFFQSRRSDLYRARARQLLEKGAAYLCFCSPDVLEGKRKEAEAQRRAWIYDRACLGLTAEESRRRMDAGEKAVTRFRVPDGGATVFNDLVQGEIRFENSLIEDFVLLRSDGQPTYHLSVVSDDIDMGITHILRGADHISNTPKQILLYQALGESVPRLGHLPLILGADKKRLSKRHGATAVEQYRSLGILPQALVNYLALLGWAPAGDQEVMETAEIVRQFDLARVNKTNAVFDTAKLEWINSQHIQRMEPSRLAESVRESLAEAGLLERSFASEPAALEAGVTILRSRCKTLRDFAEWGRAFFVDDFPVDPDGKAKYLSDAAMPGLLRSLAERYEGLQAFSLEATEAALRELAAAAGVKPGALIGAARVALTGNPVAPGLFEVMLYLGRERTIARLRQAA